MQKKRKQTKKSVPTVEITLPWSVWEFIAKALDIECRERPRELCMAARDQIDKKLARTSHLADMAISGSVDGFFGILNILKKRKFITEAIALNTAIYRLDSLKDSEKRSKALKEARELVEADIKNGIL